MSDLGKNMIDYASQRFTPEETTTTTETAIVADTVVDKPEATTETTEIVEQAPTQELVIETPTVDYNKFLQDESEGLFPDVDSFKGSLSKFKEYDTVVTQKTELEEKLKGMFVPANDYVKTVNEMIQSGKTIDEIENFTKLSKVDLDQAGAIDVKVMRMVNDGYSEAIARQIVESEYPLNDFEEGTTERMILEEKLRVSSLDDRKVLKEVKKELTTIDNSAQTQAEQQRLAGIAQAEEHKKAVKQVIPSIAEKISGLGEKNLNGKEGEEAVKLNFDYNQEFKAGLPKMLESFFLDGGMEVNEQNIKFAEHYIKADYLAKNEDQIFQSIFKHAEAITTEKMVNKYENRTGLPVESTNVVVDDTAKAYGDFLTKVATGR